MRTTTERQQREERIILLSRSLETAVYDSSSPIAVDNAQEQEHEPSVSYLSGIDLGAFDWRFAVVLVGLFPCQTESAAYKRMSRGLYALERISRSGSQRMPNFTAKRTHLVAIIIAIITSTKRKSSRWLLDESQSGLVGMARGGCLAF